MVSLSHACQRSSVELGKLELSALCARLNNDLVNVAETRNAIAERRLVKECEVERLTQISLSVFSQNLFYIQCEINVRLFYPYADLCRLGNHDCFAEDAGRLI